MTTTDPRVLRSRAAVVQGAAELLLAEGPAAVTVDAVVQRTGVARSTIYRHFPTSTDVLRAAVDAVLPPPPMAAGSVAAAASAGAEPPQVRAALRAGLRALAEQLATGAWVRALPALLELVARDPALEAHRDELVARHRAPLGALLAAARDAGDLPADADLDEVAARLVGPLFYRRLVTGEPLTPALCDRLLDAVLTPGDPS